MIRRNMVGGVLAAFALATMTGCAMGDNGSDSGSSPSSSASATQSASSAAGDTSSSEASGSQAQNAIDDLVKASPIEFAPQSASLSTKSTETLKTIAENLQKSPETKIKVTGFVGKAAKASDASLKELSQKRATAVADQLTKDGVKKENISTEVGEPGKGMSAKITVED